ncbi:DUF6049 family protein [Nonomuraea sediminis]|uniref:DUF6049 family protein n=1 Tax=Nonomuraea sediminis TaxID=2835864 RepID=UPI001BDCE182|nr:DUF6049 family protein [Nonomuraea sediminis]
MIRKAALIASLSAALLAPMVATAPSAAAGKQAVALTLGSVTPDYSTELNTEIKFSGTVSNTTSTPLSGLTIRLRYSPQRFADRASMRAFLAGSTTQQLTPSTTSQLSNQAVAANGSLSWEITRSPVQLSLRQYGVYPVAVEVVQLGYQVIAEQRTVITYAPTTPGQKPQKTKLAVALPVIDQPHRSDDAHFVDDKLVNALGQKGMLTNLAKIAKSAPKSVTWFVEPGLLDDLNQMSSPYTVRTKKNGDQAKPASQEAKLWLDTMRAELARSPVAALPYADPDVAALAHQGLDTQTAKALALGGQKARQLLKRDDIQTALNWPVDGVLDADALDLLSVGHVQGVLLNSANVPTQQPVTYTPDAAATLDTVGGPVTALLTDPELSRTFEFEPGGQGSTTLNKLRFIAETAMIAGEPGQTTPRSVVVAPSRRWNPNPMLVTTLLKTAGKLPWLQLTQLGSIKPGKTQVPRAGLTYTEQNRKDELGPKYLTPIKELAANAALTSQITVNKGDSPFDAAVLRAVSGAWRNSTPAGRGLTKQVQSTVKTTMGQIQITGADRPRTLAGSEGQVPISVRNSGTQTISLFIDVKSNDPDVLAVDFNPKEPLTILKGQSGGVQVPMAAKSSGDATVTVQLRTADGQPYGKASRLTIRTTGYTGIALVIVGAALAVMLAAVVTRILRRRSLKKPARTPQTRESESV